MSTALGRLERLTDIREIWPDEARRFTPWLAEPANLSLLSEAIGYGAEGLELVGVERSVGSFRADILARDALSAEGAYVLVENQYGRTDHDHLGKLLTYASGIEAVAAVVMIAEEIREEHRAVLDWLNQITREGHGFFGVELELWRIADSPPAPRFNLVSWPNDWARRATEGARAGSGEVSELQQLYLRYWEALGEEFRRHGGPLRPFKPQPQNWVNFGLGRSYFSLGVVLNSQKRWIRAELVLWGPQVATAFQLLEADRSRFNERYGSDLVWDAMPGRKSSRISETLAGVDVADEADWPRQHDWLAERLERLWQAFHEPVRRLDLDGPDAGAAEDTE